MKHELEYPLMELRLIPNCAAYVYGTADVEYSIAPPDPDSGIFSEYVDDIKIVGISIDGCADDDSGRQLDSTEPLYKLIEAALFRDNELGAFILEFYLEQKSWGE